MDLRPELKARLAGIESRYHAEMSRYQEEIMRLEKGHRDTIDALTKERELLQQLMELEDQRDGLSPAASQERQNAQRRPLVDILTTKVPVAGPMSKEQLRPEVDKAAEASSSRAAFG